MTTAQDQQSRAEFEAWFKSEYAGRLAAQGGEPIFDEVSAAWKAWQAARALPAGDDALLPIAAKSHGAWDGLEELLALPDGTEVYTAAQVQAMLDAGISGNKLPPGWQAVPVEPTVEQIDAAHAKGFFRQLAIPLYDAMLAAAPRPPAAMDAPTEDTPSYLAQMFGPGPAPRPPAEQERKPLFWVRLLRDGLYEGPVHANSVGGKMMRDEKPDEWHPLYLGTIDAAHGIKEGGSNGAEPG